MTKFKKISLGISAFYMLICSCNFLSKDKPTDDKMKECLGNELANKAIIVSYEQQDGLTREKDGVKYYEGYFNAEIKFIANSANYKAGEQYKIIKGTISFMKTENGWNCQSFDMSASNLVKIKEQGESSDHINAKEDNLPKQVLNQDDPQNESSITPPPPPNTSTSANTKSANTKSAKKYIAVINDPDGYTNVRDGMSTNAKIIDRLSEGENFEVFPSSDNNWWIVYTQSKVKGYVHKSRIKIIN
jgi:hypothetical protein